MDTTQTAPSFYDPDAAVRRLATEAQVDAVKKDTETLNEKVETIREGGGLPPVEPEPRRQRGARPVLGQVGGCGARARVPGGA